MLLFLVGLTACHDAPPVNPPPTITCEEAQDSIQAACCAGEAEHPDFLGIDQSTITYRDCDGRDVTLACATGDGGAVDETIEGEPTPDEPSAACDEAIAAAQEVCPGFEPDEDNAVECPDAASGEVLPLCDDLLSIANNTARCNPVDLRGWDPISVEEAGAIGAQFRTDPDDVTVGAPPPASTHEEGEPPPDLGPTLVDANQLLGALRLEIPGNFLRYQLAIGPLRYGFEHANTLDGVTCDPDALRCEINPLALMDLTQKMPDQGALTFELERVEVDGEPALRVYDLVYNDPAGTPPIYASWDGAVLVTADPIVVDLSQKTRLSLLPTHMPNDTGGPNESNSYSLAGIEFPDRQKSMIDQALIVSNLTQAECFSYARNPSYQTFALPVECHCPEEANGRGYCITELYPRDVPQAELLQRAITTEDAYLALCTDPLIVKSAPYKLLFEAALQGADPDLTNTRVTTPFEEHFNVNAPGKITLDLAYAGQRVVDFGCSGRTSTYARVGPQLTEDFGSWTGTVGQGTTSAAGFELVTPVAMGGLTLTLVPGEVVFGLPFYAQIEEWLRRRFKSFLSWFLKWVMRLLGGVIDIDVSVDLPAAGLPNTATLKFDPLDLRMHGVVGQISRDSVDGIEIGMRRIATNQPYIDRDDWALDVRWDAANCKNIFAANQSLLDRFKALIGCPFDVIEGAAALVLGPITTFLGEQALEMFADLTDKLNTTVMNTVITETQKMENGNIISIMLQDAAYQQFFEPYYLQPLGDATRAAVGTLPTGLSLACAAAPNPSIACALAHLFVGNGMVELDVDLEILRVGAKTHYRSMQAFDGESPSYCFPPVRYCVVGDDPPGAPPFTAAQRDASQDLHEVDVAEQGGLDWRHQCAVFVDFSAVARGYIRTPSATYEMGIWPSLRTQTLVNEVFVCRNAAYCHPGSEPNYLAERAELAACSLMGDVWGHLQGTTDPYLNQLQLVATVTDPTGLAALKEVWDAFLGNTGLADEFNTFEELASFADACLTKLEAAGYAPPPMTLPADTFESGPSYACEAVSLP